MSWPAGERLFLLFEELEGGFQLAVASLDKVLDGGFHHDVGLYAAAYKEAAVGIGVLFGADAGAEAVAQVDDDGLAGAAVGGRPILVKCFCPSARIRKVLGGRGRAVFSQYDGGHNQSGV